MRKYKHHISYIVVIAILFGLTIISNSNIGSNSNNVSALSYSGSVGVGFTFNHTLSVSISPSDLVISNLVPGNTLDSNVINVSVASNASYGYTLSAIVNGDNSDLVHTNNSANNDNGNSNNIFSSIATNADLSSLDNSEDTNIWGYNYKDNTVVSPTWSNYNGLSGSMSKTLLDTNTNNTETGIDSIDFKIAAKASKTQPSGTYTEVINFTAVSNVAPMSLLDSFIASGAEQLNGYFKMQDMTHDICESVDIEGSELQLIDVRDNKVYWVAKLKDGNCWMTQNLDLDLSPGKPLTSYDSDLSTDANVYTNTSEEGPYALKKDNEEYGYIYDNGASTWIPERSTIAYNNLNSTTWQNSLDHPYSYDYLDANGNPVYPDTDATKEIAGDHGFSGNYYNWSATIASNNSSVLTTGTAGDTTKNPKNSICPKNWRLPIITYSNSTNEFAILNNLYNNGLTNTSTGLVTSPLWLIKAGSTSSGSVSSNWGFYRSSTVYGEAQTLIMRFGTNNVYTSEIPYGTKGSGFSIRCLAR